MKTLLRAMNAVIRAAQTTPVEEVERLAAAGRVLAEEVNIKDYCIETGTVLGAGEMALLAEAGIGKVPVRSLPKVGFGFVESTRNEVLADALSTVCADSTEAAELICEDFSVNSAIDAALASESEAVVLFGGDRKAIDTELKERRCRILFDATDAEPVSDVVAAQDKQNGKLILCLPSEPLDAVIALEIFLRPALLAMTGGYEELSGYLRAELYTREEIAPLKDKIRLVPVKFGYRDGTPRVEPTNGESLASLNGAGGLIVLAPDAVPLDRYSIVEVIPLPLDERYLV